MAQSRSRLALAAAIMMAAYGASRLTGLVRDIVISYQFGTSRAYEAYLAGNRIPDLVFQIVAGGAVASAFIPVYTSYLARREEDEGWRLVSSLFNIGLLVLVPLVAVLMILSPQLMQIIAPGFDAETSALAANLARIMLISPVFFTLGCFATSVLNSHQRFLLASMAPASYNVGIILGALFLARPLAQMGQPPFGLAPYSLAIGAAAGSALFLLVQVPGLMQVRMIYRPILDLGHLGVREVGRLMLPRTLGLGVAQVNFVVTLILASGMEERYAALYYAWLLTNLPLGIFAMAISTAVFPTLATQSALDQIAELKRTLTASLRLILYLTIPASIGLIVLRYRVIQLLFERGEFTAQSTEWTAVALQFYAAALFAHAATEIVTRAFYALHDTRTPVLVAAGTMVVNVVLAVTLVGFLSHGGLALATSLAATLEALTILYLARRRLGSLGEWPLLLSVGRTIVAAILMGFVVWYVAGYLEAYLGAMPIPRTAERVAFILTAIIVGCGAYLLFSLLLRSDEGMRVRDVIWRGRRRGEVVS